jgi:hypothetical protein
MARGTEQEHRKGARISRRGFMGPLVGFTTLTVADAAFNRGKLVRGLVAMMRQPNQDEADKEKPAPTEKPVETGGKKDPAGAVAVAVVATVERKPQKIEIIKEPTGGGSGTVVYQGGNGEEVAGMLDAQMARDSNKYAIEIIKVPAAEIDGDIVAGYRLTKGDLARTIDKENLPKKPKSMRMSYYLSGNVDPADIPDDIWEYMITAEKACGANRFAMYGLGRSEGNWTKIDSPAGAAGPFQIMPGKWEAHTAVSMNLRRNRKASTMAAAGIMVFMELNMYFERAALAEKRRQIAETKMATAKEAGKEDEEMQWQAESAAAAKEFKDWKSKYVSRFTRGGMAKVGERWVEAVDKKTGKKVKNKEDIKVLVTCWNGRWDQANWAFEAGMAVLFANEEQVNWGDLGTKYTGTAEKAIEMAKPTPPSRPTPEPSEAAPEIEVKKEEVGLEAIRRQRYKLSCEAAATRICLTCLEKRSKVGAVPAGYRDWEDYALEKMGKADNPVDGFYGDVDGMQAVACNKSGLGYGTYPWATKLAYDSLGISSRVWHQKSSGNESKEALFEALEATKGQEIVWQFWGRKANNHPLVITEFDTKFLGKIKVPMVVGEHCRAGRVLADGRIEVVDPWTNKKMIMSQEDLYTWMKRMGWLMALRVG